MSELQKEILNMVIAFDNDTLLSMRPLLEKLLDDEILKIDPSTNLEGLDIYDKLDILKAIKLLNDNTPTIPYEEVIKQLGIGGDTV